MPDDLQHPPRGYNTDDVATQPPPTPSRWKSRLKIVIALIILVPVLIGALYTWSSISYSYASGDQTGYVHRFSEKGGWLCKRWEGQLAMVDIPGAIPRIFHFTVRDDSLAELITETMGQNVAITYEEHRGLPTSCFGETGYYVTEVRPTL